MTAVSRSQKCGSKLDHSLSSSRFAFVSDKPANPQRAIVGVNSLLQRRELIDQPRREADRSRPVPAPSDA